MIHVLLILISTASASPSLAELSAALSPYTEHPIQVRSPVTGRDYTIEAIGLETRKGEPGYYNIVARIR